MTTELQQGKREPIHHHAQCEKAATVSTVVRNKHMGMKQQGFFFVFAVRDWPSGVKPYELCHSLYPERGEGRAQCYVNSPAQRSAIQ